MESRGSLSRREHPSWPDFFRRIRHTITATITPTATTFTLNSTNMFMTTDKGSFFPGVYKERDDVVETVSSALSASSGSSALSASTLFPQARPEDL